MKRPLLLAAAIALLGGGAALAADDPPPVPTDLDGVSAVACVKIGQGGAVTDAFLLSSTGDAVKDRDLLDWISQLHWPTDDPGDMTEMWYPMPLAIGDGLTAPEGPKSCAPPAPLLAPTLHASS